VIAAFDGFWKCQFVDMGLPWRTPGISARRAPEMRISLSSRNPALGLAAALPKLARPSSLSCEPRSGRLSLRDAQTTADCGTAAAAGHVNSVTSSICHALQQKPRETCVLMTEISASLGA
jgi:hypothetical protein